VRPRRRPRRSPRRPAATLVLQPRHTLKSGVQGAATARARLAGRGGGAPWDFMRKLPASCDNCRSVGSIDRPLLEVQPASWAGRGWAAAVTCCTPAPLSLGARALPLGRACADAHAFGGTDTQAPMAVPSVEAALLHRQSPLLSD